ncbi:MAG: ATP-binding protein [Anaerolineae bacterium]|nr:ATP-binding protein [Anaerolineae bacterium]
MTANRILLLLENPTNRRLLCQWLEGQYETVTCDPPNSLDGPFDLAILDGLGLEKCGEEALLDRKRAEDPVFLPYLLVVSRRDVGMVTRHLWQVVDELILVPVQKVELQARVEILLRTRRLSLELSLRNTDLEALVRAATHELRAPLRAIGGFAHMLAEEQAGRLDEQGKKDLERIISHTEEAESLVRRLLDFARMGTGPIHLESVPLEVMLQGCLQRLAGEIEARGASVTMEGEFPTVRVEPVLLQMILTNLLTNALKFVAPGVTPQVTITISHRGPWCHIAVRDNGIGIPPPDQERIFRPFGRLHSADVYPGVGLGLSTAQKAALWMGARLGVESTPGQGSTFWVEVEVAP